MKVRFREAPVATRPSRRDVYGPDFELLCAQLAKATRPFAPDLVVGIETGGAWVAEEMVKSLDSPTCVSVGVQRPATRLKARFGLETVARYLPQWSADGLRWFEVEMRERFIGARPVQGPDAQLAALGAPVRVLQFRPERILVVDDTVDSGRTLSIVRRAMQLESPLAEVRTAVLASTWRRPPVVPDYCLLERTLLRLPWSFDAPSPH